VIDQDIARHLKKDAMNALFEYDKGALSLEKALDAVLAYERLHSGEKEADKIRADYERTLGERPRNNASAIFARPSVSMSSFSAEQNVTVAAVSIIFRCCTTVYSTHCHYAQRNCHE
jgi:hypothetical protein